jgi:anti-anti-sigma regulatory factor
MASKAVSTQKKDESVTNVLNDALKAVESADSELMLDLSSAGRIDSGALRKMEELAGKAEQKNIKVVLRGINVDIYKVLKLGRLASRFTFAP